MSGAIVTRGMENADVEPAWSGGGISGCKIRRNCPIGKTLPMQDDLQVGEFKALSLFVVECPHPLRRSDRFGDHALGIVVPADEQDWNSRSFKTRHLAVKKQADRRVLPVSVVNVPCDDKKGNFKLDGVGNKIVKCVAAGGGHQVGKFWVFGSQTEERAPQVQIGSVDK